MKVSGRNEPSVFRSSYCKGPARWWLPLSAHQYCFEVAEKLLREGGMPAEGGRSGSPRGPGRQPHFRSVSQELALAQGDGDAVGFWHCRAPAMNVEGLWGLGDLLKVSLPRLLPISNAAWTLHDRPRLTRDQCCDVCSGPSSRRSLPWCAPCFVANTNRGAE